MLLMRAAGHNCILVLTYSKRVGDLRFISLQKFIYKRVFVIQTLYVPNYGPSLVNCPTFKYQTGDWRQGRCSRSRFAFRLALVLVILFS